MKKNYIYLVFKHGEPSGDIGYLDEPMGASTDLEVARQMCLTPRFYLVRVEDGQQFISDTRWASENISWPLRDHPFDTQRFATSNYEYEN